MREPELLVGGLLVVEIQTQNMHRAGVEGIPPLPAGQVQEGQVVRAVVLVVADDREQRHAVEHARQRPEEFLRPQPVIVPARHQVAGVQNEIRRVVFEASHQRRVDGRMGAVVAVSDEADARRLGIQHRESARWRLRALEIDRVGIRRAGLEVLERGGVEVKGIGRSRGRKAAGRGGIEVVRQGSGNPRHPARQDAARAAVELAVAAEAHEAGIVVRRFPHHGHLVAVGGPEVGPLGKGRRGLLCDDGQGQAQPQRNPGAKRAGGVRAHGSRGQSAHVFQS